jgi:membrane-associated phospholipid phosphatase
MPSLHVVIATCLACFFIERSRHRALRILGPMWAATVMFTTLTTKQHFIADVLCGFALAALSRFVMLRGVRASTAATATLPTIEPADTQRS